MCRGCRPRQSTLSTCKDRSYTGRLKLASSDEEQRSNHCPDHVAQKATGCQLDDDQLASIVLLAAASRVYALPYRRSSGRRHAKGSKVMHPQE
jgi:hypothetical protein